MRRRRTVLWSRPGREPLPRALGGHQELGLRTGTENVPGIVGLGAAAELAGAEMSNEMTRRYLFSDVFQRHQQWDVGTDFILRDLCREYGLATYGHCPDLFTDIGVQSSIYHPWVEGPHNFSFPGEDYDALAGGPVDLWPQVEARWLAQQERRETCNR